MNFLRKGRGRAGLKPWSAQPDKTIKSGAPEGDKLGLDNRNVKTHEYTNGKGEKIHIRQDKAADYGEGGKGNQDPHFNSGAIGEKPRDHDYYPSK